MIFLLYIKKCTKNLIYLRETWSHGNLDMIKWLHKKNIKGCTSEAMDWAAYRGDLDVVKWLHENRSEGCSIWAMDYAANNGHLEIVKFLHENRTEGCTTCAMDNAAADQSGIRNVT
mgnify:CR=1 FL=1